MDRQTGRVQESAHVVFAERVIPMHTSDLVFGTDEEELTYAPAYDEIIEDTVVDQADVPMVQGRISDEPLVTEKSHDMNPTQLNVENAEIEVNEDNHHVDNLLIDVQSDQTIDTSSNTIPMSDDQLDNLVIDELIPEIRRSTRTPKPVDRLNPTESLRYRRLNEAYRDRSKLDIVRIQSAKKVPFSIAIKDDRVKESVRKELKSLFDVGCVSIVSLPPNRKAIGSVWVHKFKTGPDGNYLRTKSRICPWGFQQLPDIDYNVDEVAAPTLHIESCMLFLAITVALGMFSKLLDVDGAFQLPLNKQDVYMKFPDGMKHIEGMVLKLDHSMNGTKQAAFNWNELANKLLIDLGFTATISDPCLYFKYNNNNKLSLVGLYVDDFRCASEDESELNKIMLHFKEHYSIKEQPENWWLGIKVDHDREAGTLKISQEQYILNLLKDYSMSDCKSVSTPAEPNSKLVKTPDDEKDKEALKFPYRQLVGALLWIARTCRPDIIYAVNKLGSHCNNPNTSHVIAAKRVLRYLKGTAKMGITFRKADNVILNAMSDADWAEEPEENDLPMRSTTGMLVYLLGIGPLVWMSSLQTTIAGSTAEAEYKAVGSVAKAVIGQRQLLKELGFAQVKPTTIHEDNQACIAIAKAKFSGSKTRHIKLNHHLIREYIEDQDVQLEFCSTDKMIADIFTKALTPLVFIKLRDILLSGL